MLLYLSSISTSRYSFETFVSEAWFSKFSDLRVSVTILKVYWTCQKDHWLFNFTIPFLVSRCNFSTNGWNGTEFGANFVIPKLVVTSVGSKCELQTKTDNCLGQFLFHFAIVFNHSFLKFVSFGKLKTNLILNHQIKLQKLQEIYRCKEIFSFIEVPSPILFCDTCRPSCQKMLICISDPTKLQRYSKNGLGE